MNLANFQKINELSKLCDVPQNVIASLCFQEDGRYRTFSMKKRSGGTREISSPLPTLLKIQKFLNKNVLAKVKLSDAAVGFREDFSIRNHLEPHVSSKDFAKFDIKDCFASIKKVQIVHIFCKIGFSSEAAYFLAQLCTHKNCLPQGAATSPALCNIFLHDLDSEITSFCKNRDFNYTRYADDLLISGNKISLDEYRELSSIIIGFGLEINRKSRLMRSPRKLIICGISISDGIMKIPKDYKRDLRQKSHFLADKDFLSEFFIKEEFDPFYADRIIGKLNFWSFIEPDAKFPKEYINKIKIKISEKIGSSQINQ